MNTKAQIKLPKCHCNVIHPSRVEHHKKNALSDIENFELADFFKVFGDPTRLKLIRALFLSEMCVCDLAITIDMTHSAVSHQLKVLKLSRFIKSRKDGKVVYYSLFDEHIKQMFKYGLEHIRE